MSGWIFVNDEKTNLPIIGDSIFGLLEDVEDDENALAYRMVVEYSDVSPYKQQYNLGYFQVYEFVASAPKWNLVVYKVLGNILAEEDGSNILILSDKLSEEVGELDFDEPH